jgi:hypothetical protein
MAQPIPDYEPLTIGKIKERLCVYDPRNPDGVELDEDRERSNPCFCDCCFYGTARLAHQLLTLINP